MISRRNLAFAAPAALLLGQCSGTPPTPEQVIAFVKQQCGIIITVAAQVAAIINALAGATVQSVGDAICTAWQNQQAASTQLKAAGPGAKAQVIVVINGKDYPVDVTKA